MSNLGSFIWSIADQLRGPYRPNRLKVAVKRATGRSFYNTSSYSFSNLKNDFEKRHYALYGLMCTYEVELLSDNVAECRQNMLEVFDVFLGLDAEDHLHTAAQYVLSQNIVHGDAMTMLNEDGSPITFAEWGYLGQSKYQRRDFRFGTLTQMSTFGYDDLRHIGLCDTVVVRKELEESA